jgi:transcriptional regulator with XRE-family HTH domain
MKSTIGERIRILRTIKSLSQENMANELDISVASYSNIERDITDLTVSRLIKIAKILGVKPAEILEMEKSNLISESDAKTYNSKSAVEGDVEELKKQLQKLIKEVEALKNPKTVRKVKRK